MLLKTLGTADMLCAIMILLMHFGAGHWRITFAVSAYLIIKGICFYKDVQSWADMIIGAYIWMIFFGFATIIDYLPAFYLLQKGALSMARN
jgi:hypothetical protein